MIRSIIALCAVSTLIVACDDTQPDDGLDPQTSGFEEAYEQTDLGKEDSAGCSGVVLPDAGPFAKRIALTFDDGPNAATTPRVLDILKEHGIKATFFINGSRVKGQVERDILARMLAEGHTIGNHSQNHLDLKAQTLTKMKSEVDKTHAILLAAGVVPRFFRFPFGSASCGGMSYVKGLGYAAVGWHIDSADWCFAATGGATCKASTFKYVPDQYRNDLEGYVMSQLKTKQGGVILFHDIHKSTADKLDAILSHLEDAGYTFVGVDDTTVFPRLNGITPPPPKWVGSGCAADGECNFASASTAATCNLFTPSDASDTSQVGFCTLACEGFCPDKAGQSATFCTSLDGGFTGRCVAKAGTVNGNCATVPGTSAKTAARFIGTSTAPAATATACLPR